jgi:dTDP-4-amino-4,6-dideoxygalactose transaminase
VLPCCSGTFAVELALRAVGVKAGDEVVLAAYDFPGNFRAIEAIDARPVLVDLEPASWRPDPEQIATALSGETKAVVASHLHGCLAEMPKLCQMARQAGIAVVEDACQSPGALLQGRRAGAWGDVGVLSFGGSKLLTAGRGGAILTNDARAFQRAKVFNQRGNDAFPLSELQAAVLMPQLEQLDERNRTRLENATRLLSLLQGQELIEPVGVDSTVGSPSFYKIGLLLNSKLCDGHSRAEVIAALRAEGLDVGEGFRGFHRRGCSRCRQVGTLSAARQAAEATILLHHPVLLESPEMIDRVAEALKKVLRAFYGSA